jgi:uncharacterized protein YecT (DUF1311 family)
VVDDCRKWFPRPKRQRQNLSLDDFSVFERELTAKLKQREIGSGLAKTILDSIRDRRKFGELNCAAISAYQLKNNAECLEKLTQDQIETLRFLYLAPRHTDEDYVGELEDDSTSEDPSSPCDTSDSQRDINGCLSRELKRSDERLNGAYEQIISVLNPPHQADLRNTQRSWIKYRDSSCRAESDFQFAGSAASTLLISCKRDITDNRTQEIIESYR